MTVASDLLAEIEAYCTENGMSERHFGLEVAGSHKFVGRLRAEEGVSSVTIDRARDFMAGRKIAPRVSRVRSRATPAPATASAA